MQAIFTAATGMTAAETSIEVIANNLANQGTGAYKRQRVSFEDLLYIDKQRVGTQSADDGTIRPTGVAIGVGVATDAIYSINEQGLLEETSGQFDLAISGQGHFRITLPSGEEAYTRAGAFQINADGEMVTPDGFTVSPGVTIPQNTIDITINESGEILANLEGQVAASNLGQIELVRFVNEAGLKNLGNNLLAETEASGPAVDGTPGQDGYGVVIQGFLEGSNVNSVTELTNLIKAQRGFEMNVKVMEKADQNSQTFNQSV